MVKRKAIYFGRCSNEEQVSGDSHNHQRNGARRWCGTHPDLDLDEKLSIFDEGHSAFSGLPPGLGILMAEALASKPRAEVIIVEDLDRLSRQGIDATNDILRTLVSIAGFEVHITSTGQILKPGFNNDLKDFMLNGVRSYLAHEESLKKSIRIKAAKAATTARAVIDGLAISSHVPFWIVKPKKGEKITDVIPEHAATIRRIYELSGEMNLGCGTIARIMLAEGRMPFGKTPWNMGYILDILRNRTVLGEYRSRNGDVIPNYYPAVVPQTAWDRVQAGFLARDGNNGNRCPAKRGGSRGGGRRSDMNLFGGLLRDMNPPHDYRNGRTMHYSGNKHPRPYFESWLLTTSKPNRVEHHELKAAFLPFLKDLDWQSIVQESGSPEVKEKRASLDKLATELYQEDQWIAELNSQKRSLSGGALAEVYQDLNSAQENKKRIEAQQARLHAEIAVELSKAEAFRDVDVLKRLINDESKGTLEVRLRLKAEIARRVKRIGLRFACDPKIGKIVIADVAFVNEVTRRITIYRNQFRALLYEEEKGTNRAFMLHFSPPYRPRRKQKFTDETAREVHRLFQEDKKTRLEIVSILGISRDSVEDIILGKMFVHIYREVHGTDPTCAPKKSMSKYRFGQPLLNV